MPNKHRWVFVFVFTFQVLVSLDVSDFHARVSVIIFAGNGFSHAMLHQSCLENGNSIAFFTNSAFRLFRSHVWPDRFLSRSTGAMLSRFFYYVKQLVPVEIKVEVFVEHDRRAKDL